MSSIFVQWARGIFLLFVSPQMELVESSPRRVLIRQGSSLFTFDGIRRLVLKNDRTVAGFEDVRSIQLRHASDDDSPDEWRVVLQVGAFAEIRIGQTRDDVQASILAARIATVMGKEVSAWR